MTTAPGNDPAMERRTPRRYLLPDRTAIARFAVVGAAVVVALWLAGYFFMLVFASILLAVALRGAADFLSDRTRMGSGLSLAVVIVLILLFFGISGVLMAPDIAEQFQQIWRQTRETVEDFIGRVAASAWGQNAMDQGADAGKVASTVGRTMLGIVEVVMAFGGVLVVAAFLAATWRVYRDGLLRLFPIVRRRRVATILTSTAHALRWWFLGQLVSMASLGIMTGVGLWALGIPLWPALALLTAILTFIPYLGPILAAVPILLISFSQGMQVGLYALGIYLTAQLLEDNLIMPLVQQRAVSLPPAVTLGAQVLFGLLFGALGFILATPLAAGALVIVRMAYIEDVLGDDLDEPVLRTTLSG